MADKKNPNANHRQRLRARYEREGADNFQPHELLELFLFDAIPRVNTNPIAHGLIERFGSLDGVLRAPKEELMKVKGIGERSAEYIVNTFTEMSKGIEDEILSSPVASFERASNALIWHRRTTELPITVFAMNKTHMILRIVDTVDTDPNELLSICTSCRASRAVIGIGRGAAIDADSVRKAFSASRVKLCDMITVDGYKTDSI